MVSGTGEVAKMPERIVAVGKGTVSLLQALEIPVVGSWTGSLPTGLPVMVAGYGVDDLDSAQIAALKPDLVLAPSVYKGVLAEVSAQYGFTVQYLDLENFQDTLNSLERLGVLLGKEGKAQELIEGIERREARLQRAIQGLARPKTLIMVFAGGEWFVATPDSYIGRLALVLHIQPVVLGREGQPFVPLALAELSSTPEVVLAVGLDEGLRHGQLREKMLADTQLASWEAVKEGQVFELPANLFIVHPGMEAFVGLDLLGQYLYPQADWRFLYY